MPCTSASTLTSISSIPVLPQLTGLSAGDRQALTRWGQQILAQIQAAGGATGVNAVPQQYALVAASALPPIASVSNCTVALDTTKQLFGAGSYKVSLTGSPAVLTLASNTAWPMQPGWQWLVSFFQQATAAIAGEVTVTTSAGKAYSATFTTTLDSAGWDRLYDALNLVADTSAAFGLSFTFTGGSGQTVWLDGLMLSPFYGRPSVVPSFQNGSAPLLLDNNPDGFYSKILSSRTAGNVAFNFRGAWSSTASYLTGDEVVYGPTYWVALADSANVQPATGVSAWQAVGSYSEFVGAWSSTNTYAVGAEVTYSGNYWVAVAQNSNSAPSTTNANWQIAGPAALDYVADGPTLYARVPITHFDNLTNRNISLGYTVDGSARFAVTNAADMAGVSSVDSNNRALIDFSQSGHLYKNLSNVADYGARNAVQAARLPNGSAGWFNLGTWDFATIPDSFRIDLISGTGYNPNGSQQTYTQIFMRTANYGGGGTTAPNVSGLTWQSHGGSTPITEVKLVASGSNTTGTGNSWDLYVYLNAFAGGEISWHTNSVSTFTLNGAPASDPGAASATVVIGTGGQITNTGGTGQDAILDGTTYASFPISNFDNLTNRSIVTAGLALGAATDTAQLQTSAAIAVPGASPGSATIGTLSVGPYPQNMTVVVTAGGSIAGGSYSVLAIMQVSSSAVGILLNDSDYQVELSSTNPNSILMGEVAYTLPANTTDTLTFLMARATGVYGFTVNAGAILRAEVIKR